MRRRFFAVFAIFGMFVAGGAKAQEVNADSPLSARLQEYAKLDAQLTGLFGKKEYDKAADVCRRQMKLVPDSAEPYYNIACADARMGRKDDALTELKAAVELGFNDSYHMRQDEDLASLREEEIFKTLVKKVRDRELNAPHEKGTEIDGVKTIEGFPDGGLRYRLRISRDATAAKP